MASDSPADDKMYAAVGRNWEGLSEFAQKYGFKMDSVVFTKDGSEIRMTIEQLQRPTCIGLLRQSMMGVRGTNLMDCKGEEDG